MTTEAGANATMMKKAPAESENTDLRAEYDFSRGVRGKYAQRYHRGANVVVLEPDVAKVFPTAQAVNEALRSLAGIVRRQAKAPAGK